MIIPQKIVKQRIKIHSERLIPSTIQIIIPSLKVQKKYLPLCRIIMRYAIGLSRPGWLADALLDVEDLNREIDAKDSSMNEELRMNELY